MSECCECICPCKESKEDYVLDAAGQKVYVGDMVMSSLPNIPAVRKLRPLHPCEVIGLHDGGFHLLYAGKDHRFKRWSKEMFLRWRNEAVKVNKVDSPEDGSDGFDCEACCPRARRIECDGD